jgi:hypothetical protein
MLKDNPILPEGDDGGQEAGVQRNEDRAQADHVYDNLFRSIDNSSKYLLNLYLLPSILLRTLHGIPSLFL